MIGVELSGEVAADQTRSLCAWASPEDLDAGSRFGRFSVHGYFRATSSSQRVASTFT